MTGKITLISPPDVFLNKAHSIILVNTTSEEQEAISDWFVNQNLKRELSVYFYNNERNLQWLLTAFNIAKYRYVNVSNTRDESGLMLSFLLSLENCYYSINDANQYEIFRLLNNSKIEKITEFLEKAIPIEQDETSEL